MSYAIAAAFDEAAAGGGKGAKRPHAEEGEEPLAAAKPGKGKGGLLEKKSPISLAKVSARHAFLQSASRSVLDK